MENFASISALGAALCWAIAPLISVAPAAKLGSIGFARWRMYTALIPLALLMTFQDHGVSLAGRDILLLGLSGTLGVFLGDTLLFASMNIIGPRRSSILFASSAAISAAMAMLFLGEEISFPLFIAFSFVTAGVMIAISFGSNKENTHPWEATHGALWLGLLFGVLAAVCQAAGSILAKPVMDQGVDPLAASTIRIAFAAACHTLLRVILPNKARCDHPISLLTLGQVALTSLVSMVFGMTLILLALSEGDVSWVSILSSISPILILPMLWVFLGKAPPIGAWAGAALTVLGTAMILLIV